MALFFLASAPSCWLYMRGKGVWTWREGSARWPAGLSGPVLDMLVALLKSNDLVYEVPRKHMAMVKEMVQCVKDWMLSGDKKWTCTRLATVGRALIHSASSWHIGGAIIRAFL